MSPRQYAVSRQWLYRIHDPQTGHTYIVYEQCNIRSPVSFRPMPAEDPALRVMAQHSQKRRNAAKIVAGMLVGTAVVGSAAVYKHSNRSKAAAKTLPPVVADQPTAELHASPSGHASAATRYHSVVLGLCIQIITASKNTEHIAEMTQITSSTETEEAKEIKLLDLMLRDHADCRAKESVTAQVICILMAHDTTWDKYAFAPEREGGRYAPKRLLRILRDHILTKQSSEYAHVSAAARDQEAVLIQNADAAEGQKAGGVYDKNTEFMNTRAKDRQEEIPQVNEIVKRGPAGDVLTGNRIDMAVDAIGKARVDPGRFARRLQIPAKQTPRA